MNTKILASDNAPVTVDGLKDKNQELTLRVKEIARDLSSRDLAYCAKELTKLPTIDSKEIEPENTQLPTLARAINEFLDALADISGVACTPENYLWVCDTAIRWEQRLSSVFNVSRTVELARAPIDVLPALAAGDALAEDELEHRVNSLAKVVYAHRLRLTHRDDESQKEDWHKAEVFLALGILDGTINFARRISSASYHRLENIWLAEVRELVAYLDWEKDGRVLGDPHTLDHYKKAWNDLKERLRDPKMKASMNEFGEAKRYLETNYVKRHGDHYEVDRERIDKAGDTNIIKVKSAQIREVTGRWDRDRYWDHGRNWTDAENYVKLYYENIIPAVMGDSGSAQKIIDAFDYSMRNAKGGTYKGARRIINAFEMTLAVYFLSTKTLAEVAIPPE